MVPYIITRRFLKHATFAITIILYRLLSNVGCWSVPERMNWFLLGRDAKGHSMPLLNLGTAFDFKYMTCILNK